MKKLEKLKRVEKVICDYFNSTPEGLRNKSRKPEVVEPRKWMCWLSINAYGNLEHTGTFKHNYLTFKNVADHLDIKHCNVIHHLNDANRLINEKKQHAYLAADLNERLAKIEGHGPILDLIEAKADYESQKFTESVKEYQDRVNKMLEGIYAELYQDAVMEGWRAKKVKCKMDELRDEVEMFQGFGKLFEDVKSKLIKDLEKHITDAT